MEYENSELVADAVTFSTNLVCKSLQYLGKTHSNAKVSAKWFGSAVVEGNKINATRAFSFDFIFDDYLHVQANCRVQRSDGKWQCGTAEIWILENMRRIEKFHWKFCGRLNTEDVLDVYKIEP
ncbi:MAG: hypothetical protein WCO21_00880 [bacterium]